MPGMPGAPTMPGAGASAGNGLLQQLVDLMKGEGGEEAVAAPFAKADYVPGDPVPGAGFVRPAAIEGLRREQEVLQTGSVLDKLCLTADGKASLGGIPKGCTIACLGPSGKGKTRTILAALARVASTGAKVALVIAEEGFRDEAGGGRDDLCSRLVKIGMAVTGLDEDAFRSSVLSNVYVLESQYHKTQSWDDLIARYRYLVEVEAVSFVVIDSLTVLDPARVRPAENLAALKTYNHSKGVTALCLGQTRDTGLPVGGEAIVHTADAVFQLEEMGLSSKEIAEQWGGKYRDKIDVIRAIKCSTTPTFPHAVRIVQSPETGVLKVHPDHPEAFALPS